MMGAWILVIVLFAILGIVALVLGIISLKNRVVTGKEGMIGERGQAVADFQGAKGQVKVHGEIWSARSDDYLLEDDPIVVTQVDGLRLRVKKAEED